MSKFTIRNHVLAQSLLNLFNKSRMLSSRDFPHAKDTQIIVKVLPHVKGTQVETHKSMLASKQFLRVLLSVNVCVVKRVLQLKSRNVIRLFTLPYKTSNLLNMLAVLYVFPIENNHNKLMFYHPKTRRFAAS